MENHQQHDEQLFEQLGKSRKKRRNKIIRTVLILVLAVAVVLIAAVSILQRRVREQFASAEPDVLSHTVQTGTISTVVSGSGTLANVDSETVTLPDGVELKEILISYGDKVEEGDLLAIAEQASVRSAMAALQEQISKLDEQISEAESEKVSSSVKAGVSGRVKQIFAKKGEDVAAVMVEHGALAVISLDGFLAADIETDAVAAGDTVTVRLTDEETLEGTVKSASGGKATVLVTDNGPLVGDTAVILSEEGTELGAGQLYIHNPLAVTGYAGTINQIYAAENAKVNVYSVLFTLTDTQTSVNYDALLRSRGELEEQLLQLLEIQRNGGITAPISGSVLSASRLDSGEVLTELCTLSPDISMSVTISVDETDILSLEVGQEADVTVSSVSEDTLTGIVTEIDTTGESGSYTAVVTLDKLDGMLRGMTASVDVKIQGVEDAVLVPVDALNRTSGGYYVYTSYDQQTGEYGGRVEVTVGLSNSNYAEVTSGLNPGDTVYYTEARDIFDMFSGMGFGENRGGSQGGQMPDFEGERQQGGQMPGAGAEMPQGGGMPGGRG